MRPLVFNDLRLGVPPVYGLVKPMKVSPLVVCEPTVEAPPVYFLPTSLAISSLSAPSSHTLRLNKSFLEAPEKSFGTGIVVVPLS